MRFLINSIFMFVLSGATVCAASDLSPELRKKLELLEKELSLLKEQAQKETRTKIEEGDTEGVVSPFAEPKKSDKTKQLLQKEPVVAEKTTQETPDFSHAEEFYAQSQVFLNQKHLGKAKMILQDLCDKYPEAPQFMLAKYWLGEIGLEGRDYTNASISYGEAYSAYKQKLANNETISDEVHYRAIESLAKLAYCLKFLKKNQDACVTLKQFDKESAGIPRNIHIFARQVSEQLQCKKKSVS